MSSVAQSFVKYLVGLADSERGAMAILRRSLAFEPWHYPRAYPYVEPFVGDDKHEEDPWRKSLYLTAGLFALHGGHRSGTPMAGAFGGIARDRDSASLESRFIALLEAEPKALPVLLRHMVSLLGAEKRGFDYSRLLNDLAVLLNPFADDRATKVKSRWAREFYREIQKPSGKSKNGHF